MSGGPVEHGALGPPGESPGPGRPPSAAVHQALHGYDQGHRLLAASTVLPPEAERAMLTLSDASGPQASPGFRDCLTGYPVPGTEWYAFGRTWPAPEMHRPGCVWTHTLLLHVADLAHLRGLSRLVECFRRPTGRAPDPAEYRRTLSVPLAHAGVARGRARARGVGAQGADAGPHSAAHVAGELIAAFYGPAAGRDAPVVLVTSRPEPYARLVLGVWDQQWARLRRQFSFCTAAAAPRLLGEQPLALQVLPPSALRLWPRGTEPPVVVRADGSAVYEAGGAAAVPHARDEAEVPGGLRTAVPDDVEHVPEEEADRARSGPAQAAWVASLVADLADADPGVMSGPPSDGASSTGHRSAPATEGQSRGPGPLRDFLARFAVDLPGPQRAAVRVLADVHERLRRAVVPVGPEGGDGVARALHALRRVLDVIDEAFPNPKVAARLKRAVFGGPGPSAASDLGLPEPAVLAVLAASLSAPRVLASVDLQLRPRARRLWSVDAGRPARALLRVVRDGATQLGEEILAGLAEGVPDGAVLETAAEHPGLLYHVVRVRPAVAEWPALWRGAPALRREAVTALESMRRDADDGVPAPDTLGAKSVAAGVVRTLLDASLAGSPERLSDAAETAATVARAIGPAAVRAYLDQVGYPHLASSAADGWERALTHDVAACRNWFADHLAAGAGGLRAPALAALACALDPTYVRPVGGSAAAAWTRLARDLVDGEGRRWLSDTMRLDALGSAFAAALDERAPAGAEPLALAFGPLHAAAWSAGLSARAWARIAPRAPALHWSREWDHAERLRDALIRAFQLPGWPAAWFIRALGDGDALAYVVQRCSQTEDGRRLLRAARDAIRAGEVQVTVRQRDVFEAAGKRKSASGLFDLLGPLFG